MANKITRRDMNIIKIFLGVFVVAGLFALFSALTTETVGSDEWKDGLIVGGIFVLFPGILFAVFNSAHQRGVKIDQLAEKYPRQPWKWDPHWEKGFCPDQQNYNGWIQLIAGFLFSTPTPILVKEIPPMIDKGEFIFLLFALFPLIGLLLILTGVINLLRKKKFGKTKFFLNRETGVLGGKLEGQLKIPYSFPHEMEVDAALSCKYTYTSGSGKNRRTHTDIKWQDQRVDVSCHRMGGTTIANIEFDVPFNFPATERSASSYHHWSLDISADIPGLDYAGTFNVPVFKTADSDEQLTDQVISTSNARRSRHLADNQLETLKVADEGGRRLYSFYRKHNFKVGLVGFIFGGVFFAFGFGFYWAIRNEGLFPIIFTSIFMLVGGLIGLLSLSTLLSRPSIIVDSKGLTLRKDYFLFVTKKFFARDEVTELEIASGTRINNTLYYNLKVHSGKLRKSAGINVPIKRDIEWVVTDLKHRLSLN